jgi:hypothetical protein
MEEKLTSTNFELAVVTAQGFTVLPAAELAPLIERAVAEAAADVA